MHAPCLPTPCTYTVHTHLHTLTTLCHTPHTTPTRTQPITHTHIPCTHIVCSVTCPHLAQGSLTTPPRDPGELQDRTLSPSGLIFLEPGWPPCHPIMLSPLHLWRYHSMCPLMKQLWRWEGQKPALISVLCKSRGQARRSQTLGTEEPTDLVRSWDPWQGSRRLPWLADACPGCGWPVCRHACLEAASVGRYHCYLLLFSHHLPGLHLSLPRPGLCRLWVLCSPHPEAY